MPSWDRMVVVDNECLRIGIGETDKAGSNRTYQPYLSAKWKTLFSGSDGPVVDADVIDQAGEEGVRRLIRATADVQTNIVLGQTAPLILGGKVKN